MGIWDIAIIVVGIVIYVLFYNFKEKVDKEFKINLPVFSESQRHEFLKVYGPSCIADAFEITKGGYDYGWNNVLKAAAIMGDATGADVNEAVRHLIFNLDIDEPNLVAISAVSLGKLKDQSALPHLEKLINSQPSQSEIESHHSMLFEKSQREEYARRSGATLSGYPSIPEPVEKHKNIRDAALWAINEIKKDDLIRNEKINS